jgi:hypothetical protein
VTNVRDLYHELRACQRRLGTPAETADDFERVLTLAHELNNRLTAEYLRAVSEAPEESSRTLAEVCKQCLRG